MTGFFLNRLGLFLCGCGFLAVGVVALREPDESVMYRVLFETPLVELRSSTNGLDINKLEEIKHYLTSLEPDGQDDTQKVRNDVRQTIAIAADLAKTNPGAAMSMVRSLRVPAASEMVPAINGRYQAVGWVGFLLGPALLVGFGWYERDLRAQAKSEAGTGRLS